MPFCGAEFYKEIECVSMIEGVGMNGVDILASADNGAHIAFRCHGGVIEARPCAEATQFPNNPRNPQL